MRYNVAQLLKGPIGARRQYTLRVEPTDLDAELRALSPLVGSITLTHTSRGVLVEGTIYTVLRAACRRCLADCEVEVQLELEEEFRPTVPVGDRPWEPVTEDDFDDALLLDAHHTLDLGEVIRQGLWVAAPMEALCRQDCLGICPECGENRNSDQCHCLEPAIDPRWASLQALIAEEPESAERSN
jgi:uncharacterized protein